MVVGRILAAVEVVVFDVAANAFACHLFRLLVKDGLVVSMTAAGVWGVMVDGVTTVAVGGNAVTGTVVLVLVRGGLEGETDEELVDNNDELCVEDALAGSSLAFDSCSPFVGAFFRRRIIFLITFRLRTGDAGGATVVVALLPSAEIKADCSCLSTSMRCCKSANCCFSSLTFRSFSSTGATLSWEEEEVVLDKAVDDCDSVTFASNVATNCDDVTSSLSSTFSA